MRLPLLLLSVVLAAACGQPPTPANPPGVPPTPAAPAVADPVEEPPPPPPPEDADCNLSTKLQEGIPGSPGHLIVSPRNPNGDSELALLMRTFVDQLRDARTLVEAGQPVPKFLPTWRKMRCAWPTKPDERNEKFDTRAIGFLQQVEAFDEHPGRETYNSIIAGCIACHSQSCGGPIDFIDSMKW